MWVLSPLQILSDESARHAAQCCRVLYLERQEHPASIPSAAVPRIAGRALVSKSGGVEEATVEAEPELYIGILVLMLQAAELRSGKLRASEPRSIEPRADEQCAVQLQAI